MDDSFADRMRNRALQRIQKNSHVIKENTGLTALKQQNIAEVENKENHNDDCEIMKPIIAEKLSSHSPVQSSKSRDYKRIESDSHLNFDFKKARSIFNEDEEKKMKKVSVDPCLLSVAERRKLFEKRLRGEDVETNSVAVPEKLCTINTKSAAQELTESIQVEDVAIENNESNSESSSIDELPEKPVLNVSEDTCSSFSESFVDQDADLSSVFTYPVPQTVKQVKFVSTPKPGRLYPSISDLDSDDEEPDIKKNKKNDDSFSIIDHDHSFGRDVLCVTNSIFSSFQNSRKETTEFLEKSTIDEVKDLIYAGKETPLSLSSLSPSSVLSVEGPNETASFTYMENYSDLSIDVSPIPLAAKVLNFEKVESEDQNDVEEMDQSKNDALNVEEKIKLLEEEMVKEKIKYIQAVRALKLCLSTTFLNSLSHLETEKVVLLSQLRIAAAQNEIARIKPENSGHSNFSDLKCARGDIVISNIKLPLKKGMVQTYLKDHICNNLLCIIKCGDIVLSTEVMPVVKREPEAASNIEFSDIISIPNINSNFKISVEVYNLIVKGKGTPNSKKDKKNASSSKKDKENKFFSKHFNEGNKFGHSFVKIGYITFSLNEVRRRQWTLNMQNLHHPLLVGIIEMNVKCNLALTSVRKHGFLTMYEVISGYGAWSRYWFYLSSDKLSYWKYPEEEAVKDPLDTIDLRNCVTNLVDVVGIEITMRPHTFMLQFNPPSYFLNFGGLAEDGLLLSADNLEERTEWSSCLNEVLQSIRLWTNRSD